MSSTKTKRKRKRDDQKVDEGMKAEFVKEEEEIKGKIVKEEERCIRFLDDKGFVRQLEFLHGKSDACDHCRFDPICAGMFSMAKTYDERELSPVFEDPAPVIEQVLGERPSDALMARLDERRGRRSPTEQPSPTQRASARLRLL